jgi:hypothetical protein
MRKNMEKSRLESNDSTVGSDVERGTNSNFKDLVHRAVLERRMHGRTPRNKWIQHLIL